MVLIIRTVTIYHIFDDQAALYIAGGSITWNPFIVMTPLKLNIVMVTPSLEACH